MCRATRAVLLVIAFVAAQHAGAPRTGAQPIAGPTGPLAADVWLGRGLVIEAGASRRFAEKVQKAYQVFARDRQYAAAAALFSRLLEEAVRGTDWKLLFGLRNASLYASGQYEAALRLICEEGRSEPYGLTELEEVFEIHAHARALALAKGRDHAAAVLSKLRTDCGRATFSAVWLGIPLAKMEYLRAGVFVMDEAYVLRVKDRVVLEHFIERFPSDELVDYAHYFLHHFDQVHRPELKSLKRTNDYSPEDMLHLEWEHFWRRMPGDQYIETLILEGRFEAVSEYVQKLPPAIRRRARNEAAANVPPLLRDAMAIHRVLETGNADEFLEHAIEVRGELGYGRPYAASKMFRYLAENFPDTLAGEKARYLHFLAQRRRIGGWDGDPERLLRDFIKLYPTSHLIDDAYTELALLVRWERDQTQYKWLLEKVFKEYPESNAADNALYFLMQDALRSRKYLTALSYAMRIATYYPKTRLGRKAVVLAPQVEPARSAMAERRYLSGLALVHQDGRYWRDFEGGLSIAKADEKMFPELKKMRGLRLAAIGGQKLSSDVGFFAALSRSRLGASLPATVTGWGNRGEVEIEIAARVIQVEVFDVVSVAADDVLNVRLRPTHLSEKVGEIPHDAKCVRYAGQTVKTSRGGAWFEINYAVAGAPTVSGWVNSHFLHRSRTCLS